MIVMLQVVMMMMMMMMMGLLTCKSGKTCATQILLGSGRSASAQMGPEQGSETNSFDVWCNYRYRDGDDGAGIGVDDDVHDHLEHKRGR